MNKAYLLIGGNIGNRENYLYEARIRADEAVGKVLQSSSIYETAAWGIEDQSPFLNQVLLLDTPLNPYTLLQELLSIEEGLGRKRMIKFGPRTIDMDILLFNNEVLNEVNLNIPHPALPHRRFALVPLCEIAPEIVHPALGKTISELLAECEDALPVIKYNSQAQ